MTDNVPQGQTPDDEPHYYEETIVEYVDNRRQRAALAVILVILFFLLLAAAYTIYRLTPGTGAPTGRQDTPTGITWIRSIYGWGNNPGQQLIAPTDVDIAPDGIIWVTSGHDTIVGFNPDGTTHKVIQPKTTASIEGVSVGDDGHLYITDFAGQIVEFDTSGNQIDQWKVELPNVLDVKDGKIAVAAGPGIAVFTPEGKMLVQIGGTRGWEKDQFDLPHGIILAPDGKIYVADTQNRRVKALTPSGRIIWILGEAPNRSVPGVADVRSQNASMTNNPFLLPSGMALDGNGRIAVIDPFRFRIAFIDAKTGQIAREPGKDGKPGRQAFYGDSGQADGFFSNPTGIAYDKTRDWFAVADTSNNRVQILRVPGSGGNALAPVIGAFRLPMCIFCLPLILLLLAIVALAMQKRRQRDVTPTQPVAADLPATEEA